MTMKSQNNLYVHQYTDKGILVYTYNGLLFRHKKEQTVNMYYSLDEPWKYYAKWEKPDRKSHILYDFWYDIFRIGKFIETENRL